MFIYMLLNRCNNIKKSKNKFKKYRDIMGISHGINIVEYH
jgi:hypothetical protein